MAVGLAAAKRGSESTYISLAMVTDGVETMWKEETRGGQGRGTRALRREEQGVVEEGRRKIKSIATWSYENGVGRRDTMCPTAELSGIWDTPLSPDKAPEFDFVSDRS